MKLAAHRRTENDTDTLRIKRAVGVTIVGQGLIGKKVEPSQLLPGVQADLWALVTMVNLQARGYVRVG